MDKQTTREIDLRDMFYRILKKWRSILFVAAALALAMGLYRFAAAWKVLNDPAAEARALERYQSAMVEYETTRSSLETQRDRTGAVLEDMRDYNENSVLLRIDPLNEWVGSVFLYVGAEENAVKAGCLAAYDAYLSDGELFQELAQQSERLGGAAYAAELFTFDADIASSGIRIRCIGDSEAFVREMTELARKGLEKKRLVLLDTVGEHEITLLGEGCYASVDRELFEQQSSIQEIYEESLKTHQEAEKKLQSVKAPEAPELYGRSRLVKQSISGALAGLIGGAAVTTFALCLWYMLSNTMKGNSDWKAAGLPVLARVQMKRDGRRSGKIDQWIDRRLAGGLRVDADEAYRLASGNLLTLLRGKGLDVCGMVSELPEDTGKAILEKLSDRGSGIRYELIGSLLSDPDAARKLDGTDAVVILGRSEETTLDTVWREIMLLHSCGKEILGAIVID